MTMPPQSRMNQSTRMLPVGTCTNPPGHAAWTTRRSPTVSPRSARMVMPPSMSSVAGMEAMRPTAFCREAPAPTRARSAPEGGVMTTTVCATGAFQAPVASQARSALVVSAATNRSVMNVRSSVWRPGETSSPMSSISRLGDGELMCHDTGFPSMLARWTRHEGVALLPWRTSRTSCERVLLIVSPVVVSVSCSRTSRLPLVNTVTVETRDCTSTGEAARTLPATASTARTARPAARAREERTTILLRLLRPLLRPNRLLLRLLLHPRR